MNAFNPLEPSFSHDQLLPLAFRSLQAKRYEDAEDYLAHALDLEVFRIKGRDGQLLLKLTLRKNLNKEQIDETFRQVQQIVEAYKPKDADAGTGVVTK